MRGAKSRASEAPLKRNRPRPYAAVQHRPLRPDTGEFSYGCCYRPLISILGSRYPFLFVTKLRQSRSLPWRLAENYRSVQPAMEVSLPIVLWQSYIVRKKANAHFRTHAAASDSGRGKGRHRVRGLADSRLVPCGTGLRQRIS